MTQGAVNNVIAIDRKCIQLPPYWSSIVLGTNPPFKRIEYGIVSIGLQETSWLPDEECRRL